jgi:hypothetical protein
MVENVQTSEGLAAALLGDDPTKIAGGQSGTGGAGEGSGQSGDGTGGAGHGGDGGQGGQGNQGGQGGQGSGDGAQGQGGQSADGGQGGQGGDGSGDGGTTENPIITTFAERLKLKGIDVEVPEELNKPDANPEEVINFIERQLEENVAYSDPFINEYVNASKQEGFSREKFLQQYNHKVSLLNLPSKDFLYNYFKSQNGKSEQNPDGWTDEEINTHLSKLTRIELDTQAGQLKSKLKESIFKPKVDPEALAKKAEIANKALSKRVNTLFDVMSQEKEFGGIPHTEEDAKNFKEFFSAISTINPKTGRPILSTMLNDDKVLYKAMYLLWKAEGTEKNIKAWLSDFKEGYKEDVLNRTRVNQRRDSGNARQVTVMKPEDYV